MDPESAVAKIAPLDVQVPFELDEIVDGGVTGELGFMLLADNAMPPLPTSRRRCDCPEQPPPQADSSRLRDLHRLHAL